MMEYIQSGKPGFGLRVEEDSSPVVSIEHLSSNLAQVDYQLPEKGISVSTTLGVSEVGEVVQKMSVTNNDATSPAREFSYLLHLGISVHRASYGQLTEGGPIPLPQSENNLEILGNNRYFSIINPYLDGHIEGCLDVDGKTVEFSDLQRKSQANAPVQASVRRTISLPSNATTTITARFRVTPDTRFHGLLSGSNGKQSNDDVLGTRPVWVSPDDAGTFIVRRNLDYIVGNCAVPVSTDEVALMTDHAALPLGWNRDN
jgi:hypothetical protein